MFSSFKSNSDSKMVSFCEGKTDPWVLRQVEISLPHRLWLFFEPHSLICIHKTRSGTCDQFMQETATVVLLNVTHVVISTV